MVSHKGVGSVAERRQGTWASDRVRFMSSTCDYYRFPAQLLSWLWKVRIIAVFGSACLYALWLGRQRQWGCCCRISLHSKVQARQGYRMRPCFKNCNSTRSALHPNWPGYLEGAPGLSVMSEYAASLGQVEPSLMILIPCKFGLHTLKIAE